MNSIFLNYSILSYNISYIDLIDYHDCIQQLREDLIECEGPADWFEKTNKNIVCQYLNDILNCNYIKAAMLCSVKPAQMLRNFSYDILKTVVLVIKLFLKNTIHSTNYKYITDTN